MGSGAQEIARVGGDRPRPRPRGRLRPLSIAPMMDRTDRHYRVMMRGLTQHTLLYTEMVTTGAILRGDTDWVLAYDPVERPLALQLGGDDAAALAECAQLAHDLGYDEVNLNVGCPSDRVQKGRFGACLMKEPERVADSVAAMRAAVPLPVTVKHRIGVDDLDSYDHLERFVETVADAGCDRFSVHARKAWLQGLSPKQNREVPPLRYEDVYRLKRRWPQLEIEINGGILDLDQTMMHLQKVDAVMIGRAAYDRPFLFADADRRCFGARSARPSRRQAIETYLPYIDQQLASGVSLSRMSRHLLAMCFGQRGGRAWRRHLSEHAHVAGAGTDIVRQAMARVPDEVLDARPLEAEREPAASAA